MIDGASTPQVFRHIKVPHLAPVTVFAAVWQTITALQLFDIVFTTTKGGPLGSTQTVVYYVYYQAFQLTHFGYASAIAYILFGFTLLITAGVIWYSRRGQDGGVLMAIEDGPRRGRVRHACRRRANGPRRSPVRRRSWLPFSPVAPAADADRAAVPAAAGADGPGVVHDQRRPQPLPAALHPDRADARRLRRRCSSSRRSCAG